MRKLLSTRNGRSPHFTQEILFRSIARVLPVMNLTPNCSVLGVVRKACVRKSPLPHNVKARMASWPRLPFILTV